jgi:hypothetical protein
MWAIGWFPTADHLVTQFTETDSNGPGKGRLARAINPFDDDQETAIQWAFHNT